MIHKQQSWRYRVSLSLSQLADHLNDFLHCDTFGWRQRKRRQNKKRGKNLPSSISSFLVKVLFLRHIYISINSDASAFVTLLNLTAASCTLRHSDKLNPNDVSNRLINGFVGVECKTQSLQHIYEGRKIAPIPRHFLEVQYKKIII